MNAIYRTQRHIYDATRAFYLLGRDRLIDELDAGRPGTTVLEIACGTGRNLIKIARRYPAAQLYGFDVSSEMLLTADKAVQAQALQSRIRLAEGDAKRFESSALFGRDGFDRVVFSYALSMIPGWEEAFSRAVQALSPGGSLHVVDFGAFSGYPEPLRRVQIGWLNRFSVHPIENLAVRLKSMAEAADLDFAVLSLYGDYSVLARLKRR